MANKSDFTWLQIRGEDGKTYYTWVAYADDNAGANINTTPQANSTHIGLRYNESSAQVDTSDPTKFTWIKIKGVDGKDGKDGKCVDIKGSVSSSTELVNQATAVKGDGYITQDDGHLHVLTGDSYAVANDWTDVGRIKGEKGDKGEQGIQGQTGAQGVQGEKGDTGATGAKGDKGDKGDQGDQGVAGATGAAGKDGKDGRDGTNGLDGAKGEKGEKGEKGDKGDTGEKGEKGDTGEVGPQGIQGAQGNDGADGQDGQNGTDGKDGASLYTWMAFSAQPDGEGFTTSPDNTTKYIGFAINKQAAQ